MEFITSVWELIKDHSWWGLLSLFGLFFIKSIQTSTLDALGKGFALFLRGKNKKLEELGKEAIAKIDEAVESFEHGYNSASGKETKQDEANVFTPNMLTPENIPEQSDLNANKSNYTETGSE